MSVTEVKQALGSWSVTLRPTIPKDLLNALTYFGHIAIVEGRVNVPAYGDGLLTAARYVGVYRNRVNDVDNRSSNVVGSYVLNGVGMAAWLGDESGKGDVFETAVTLTAATFPNSVRALLPPSGAVTEGTLHSVPGTYTGRHQYQTSRQALQYVTDTFNAEWRVNGDATIDAGLPQDLYPLTPIATLVKHGHGRDPSLVGYQGKIDSAEDVEDWVSRVVLLAEGNGLSIATGHADIVSNPYKDLHGNAVAMTHVVSESATVPVNANTRAELALAEHAGTRWSLRLATSDYVLQGDLMVGGYVYVYDPDTGILDTNNETTFRGQRINPAVYRCTEISWPVRTGMTVAYRDPDGVWFDLTDHVNFEDGGDTSLTVGELPRSLSGGGVEPIGTRPSVDTSIPGAPTLVTPFQSGAYLDARGFTRAKMVVGWTAPLNTDGSTILDGDHYEIRYAVDTDVIYPATWSQVSQVRWQDLQTWAQPFAYPDGEWQIAYAPWGDTSLLIQDLSPGIGYDVQIRAVDKSGNAGAWSGTVTAVAEPDNIPPSTPAAPEVAASRIAIQVIHRLGLSSGGEYNLESDLDHFDVHVSSEPTFTPSEATRVGKLRATGGMIHAEIPAVGTFQVEDVTERWVKVLAVDQSGNASNASEAASATALLIDDAYISDLTVSKVTAGTISADWLIGASIKTAESGARVELSSAGLLAFNDAGTQTVNIASSDGSVSIIGQLASGESGQRIVVSPDGADQPQIRFYPTGDDSNYARLSAYSGSGPTAADMTMESGKDTFLIKSAAIMQQSLWSVGRYDDDYAHEGGYVSGNSFLARVGFEDALGENYFQFGDNEKTFHIGKWDDFIDRGALAGIFTGHLDVAGATSSSISYGATAASFRRVVASNNDTQATGVISGIQVNGQTSAGFTGEINAYQGTGWTFQFWAFRQG